MSTNPQPSRTRHIDDATAVGRRVRDAREAKGLSLRELSFPGCTAPYISAIEHGRRVPSLQILQELGRRLDVAVDYLATGGTATTIEDALLNADLALRLGDVDEAERDYTAIAQLARTDDDKAHALAGLGELRFRSGDLDAAQEAFESALQASSKAFLQRYGAVDLLGRCYALKGNAAAAIGVFSRGLRDAEERGDRLQSVRFAVLIANAYIDLGEVGASVATIASAAEAVRELADPLLRARVDWTQSRLHVVEERHDLAAEFARRALATLRVAEDDHAVARAQQLLAYVEVERGNAADALALLEAAQPTMERLASSVELAIFRLERARALAALGRDEEAFELALQIAPILVANAKGNSGRCFLTLGQVFERAEDDDGALAMYDAAIDTLRGHRSPHLLRAYQAKSQLLERLGRADAALATLKEAVALQVPASEVLPEAESETPRPRGPAP